MKPELILAFNAFSYTQIRDWDNWETDEEGEGFINDKIALRCIKTYSKINNIDLNGTDNYGIINFIDMAVRVIKNPDQDDEAKLIEHFSDVLDQEEVRTLIVKCRDELITIYGTNEFSKEAEAEIASWAADINPPSVD